MIEISKWVLDKFDKYIKNLFVNGKYESVILYLLNDKSRLVNRYGSIDELNIDRDFEITKELTSILAETSKSKESKKISINNFPYLKKELIVYASPIIIQDQNIGHALIICTKSYYSDMLSINLELIRTVVEDMYIQMKNEEKLLQEIRYQKTLAESLSMGYMAVNREGIIEFMNKAALEILGVGEEVIGKNLREITDFEPELFQVLETGKGWSDKEFIIDMKIKKNIHLIKTCIPIFNDQKNVIGVIDTFKEIKNIKKLVNKITGAKSSFTFNDIIYRSEKMDYVVQFSKKISLYDSSVLIQGESGTGKELFAHAIHHYSNRRNAPFVTIDCSAIPHDLVESELFGYVEGAFTGARRGGRPGKFEMGNGGTIFLDEIGEMSPEIQKKLLRVLQTHTITRIGDCVPIPIDIRVIAATNRNLEEEVKEKNFREDLYYRLNVINLQIPPLRERKEDVIPTVEHFIRGIGNRIGKTDIQLSDDVMNLLINYQWPGNVRQLKNIIERCMNLLEGKIITCELLPNSLLVKNTRQENNYKLILTNFERLERREIIDMLNKYNGNKTKVSKSLGIARSTLYLKIKKYNIIA